MTTKKTTLNPTPEQIAAWKEEHGIIYQVAVDGKEAIVAFPTWTTWKQASTALADGNSVAYVEAILRNGFVAGDEDIADTDAAFLNLKKQFDDIIEFADVTKTKVGNAYELSLQVPGTNEAPKVFKCKPVTREIITESERANAERKMYVTAENILKRVLISGDEAVLKSKTPMYYIPLIAQVEKLYEEKVVNIKKL